MLVRIALLTLAVIVFFASSVTPCIADREYTLSSASIAFSLPKGDDKDNDTSVSVYVKTMIDEEYYTLASRANFAATPNPDESGTWEDPSPHDYVYDLNVNSFSYSQVGALYTKIRISPNGNDTVKFGYTVTLKFTKGSGKNKKTKTMTQTRSGIELSESNTTYNS